MGARGAGVKGKLRFAPAAGGGPLTPARPPLVRHAGAASGRGVLVLAADPYRYGT